MALLAVSRLTKSFGGVTAIEDLTFAIEPGTIFGIIGPNGAGKTSLFNVLSGFVAAGGGSARLRGTEVLGKKPYELVALGIARSFQLVKPFLGMTALETVLLPSWGARIRRQGASHRELESDARRALDRLGLGARATERVDDFNQGELRLLDVARAVATHPDVLLLDEPFSGLGHEHIAGLSAVLTELRASGMAIVIIEHRLRELMRLVERVMVMNFGKKLAEGAPADVVEDPAVIEAYLGTKGKGLVAARD